MPQFKTVFDRKLPTEIPAEQLESQKKGSTGLGFGESYADKMASFNHGTGLGKGEGKEQFPEASDYKE
jgi:hypothetical protein